MTMNVNVTNGKIAFDNMEKEILIENPVEGTLKVVTPDHFHASQPLQINYLGGSPGIQHNLEIQVGVGSTLRCIEIFQSNDDFRRQKTVRVAKDGHFDHQCFVLNTGDATLTSNTSLHGTGGSARTATVAIPGQEEIQEITVTVTNDAPHTKANITNYGIVKDNAKLTFAGTGHVPKGNKNADAKQETRILSLSKTAQATANPFLLIDEGEITAGHAAAIGQVDEEQIYYLMSRGMSQNDAKQLIVNGFLSKFIDEIKDEQLRETVAGLIDRKLK